MQHPTSVNEGQPKTSPVVSDIKPRPPDSSPEENKEMGICALSLDSAGANDADYYMANGDSRSDQSNVSVTGAR